MRNIMFSLIAGSLIISQASLANAAANCRQVPAWGALAFFASFQLPENCLVASILPIMGQGHDNVLSTAESFPLTLMDHGGHSDSIAIGKDVMGNACLDESTNNSTIEYVDGGKTLTIVAPAKSNQVTYISLGKVSCGKQP